MTSETEAELDTQQRLANALAQADRAEEVAIKYGVGTALGLEAYASAKTIRVQHNRIYQLEAKLALANNAASKGDSSRANAGGMELRIAELEAQLAQRQVPGDGWVMVPREPTKEMIAAGIGQGRAATVYSCMLAASPTPPQREPTADDLREPKSGKEWRVEWWNESLRMMLPSSMQLDGVRHFSSGTMTLTLKQRKSAHGIKGADQ